MEKESEIEPMSTRSSEQETNQITALAAEAAPTHCNHTAVGMIVERSGKYLLFRRVKKPWGHAPSAGHVDELPYIDHPDEAAIYEAAARRELEEEVGLIAERLDLLLSEISYFPCRRIGGNRHKWRVYHALVNPGGKPTGKTDESRDLTWYWPQELELLAERTRAYLAGHIEESDWEANPGLEPVWVGFFERLGVLAPSADIPELTPSLIFERFSETRWRKNAPTRIKAVTEDDITAMGPTFIDLEGKEQRVALGRCICIGMEDEKWTCSTASLTRDRYPVSMPDAEGYRLYLMRNPSPVSCFDIPYAFRIQSQGKSWQSQPDGGIVTWNGKHGPELDMRIIKRSLFNATYSRDEE